MKIDKRKTLYLILDTETTGTLDNPIIYNIAWQLIDKKGNIYIEEDYLINEIFFNDSLMKTAYFYNKTPFYYEKLQRGQIIAAPKKIIINQLRNIFKKYEKQIKFITAYNAKFDKKAIENTFDNVHFKKYQWGCLWQAFKSLAETARQKTYTKFCDEYNFKTKHEKPQNQTKAETAYRYIINNIDFIESHTALEDVKIESEILIWLLRQHKKLNWNF